MTAESNAQATRICFEVHARRDEHWLVAEAFEDQAAALEYAERLLRQRRDVHGIKVVRGSYDPDRDEAFEQVVFDSGIELRKPFRWLMASLSGIGLPAPWAGR